MCRAGRSNRERCLVLRFANVGILFENAKPYPGYLRERKLIESPKKSITLPGSSNPRLSPANLAVCVALIPGYAL